MMLSGKWRIVSRRGPYAGVGNCCGKSNDPNKVVGHQKTVWAPIPFPEQKPQRCWPISQSEGPPPSTLRRLRKEFESAVESDNPPTVTEF